MKPNADLINYCPVHFANAAQDIVNLRTEIERLRSLVDDQLRTIKALTHGCEAYGLTETTPIVRHMAAQDAEIERLTTELAVERKRVSSYRTLVSSLESQLSRHRANASEAAEAIRTLDSERAANAVLTAELAAYRDALAKIGPYYVPSTELSDDEVNTMYAMIDTARKGEGE